MKANVFRMLRSGIAMILALCMVIGMCPVHVFAAEVGDKNDDGIINYVSFGASNVNGYGLTGYMEEGTTAANKADANVYGYQRMPEGSYPYLVAQALNEKMGGTVKSNYKGATEEEPFSKVHVDQLAMSSMRAEELRFLVDETYRGDNYTDWRFYDVNGDGDSKEGNWFGKAKVDLPTLRGLYADAIRNADLITYDMGINNFGVFMNRAMTGSVSTDLNDINPEIAAQYAEAKEYVRSVVAENSGELVAMMDSMDTMIDALAFTLVGFCTSFDATMEKIYELNPDANVVVVSIQCLLTGLDLKMDGMESTLPLGEIFGEVINAANMYTAKFSPYSDKYYYADVSENGRVEFFVDQLLAYNGDPATLDQDMIDCYMVYDDDLNYNNQIITLVNGYLAALVKAGLGEAVNYMPTIYGVNDEAELLKAYLADGANGFANAEQIANAYADYLGGADAVAALLATMKGTYDKYCVAEVALYNVIYDVLTEIMQAAVEDHTLNFSALQFEGKGRVEDDLLAAIVSNVMAAADKVVIDPSYQFEMDEVYPDGFFETLSAQAGLDASMVKTIACMGVRTGIGNSFYGHPTRNGHNEIAEIVLAAMEKEISGEVSFDRETQEKLEAFYYFLKEDDRLNTAEKVDLLEKLYSIVKGKASLDTHPEVAVVEEIYASLVENEHITDEQTLNIVLYVYERLLNDKSLSGEDVLDTGKYVYETLFYNEGLTDEDRIDIIVNIYQILVKNGYLAAYAKELKVLEEIVALEELEFVTAKQTFGIVDMLYRAIKDGTVSDAETRDIIVNIYLTLFKGGEIMPISEGEQEKILTASEKLAVIEAIYTVLEKNGYLKADEVPALKAALEIYNGLREGKLLSDEKIFELIDRVFAEMFTAEEINEETLETLIKDVVMDVLKDSDITMEQKLAIAKLVLGSALNINGEENAYTTAYDAMAALYEYLRTYMIENGAEKVLGDAYAYLEANGYIEKLEKATDALIAQIKKELNDYLNDAEPELRGALTALTQEAEKLNEQLLALKGELDAKVAELEKLMASAANETNADILAAIEATKAAIATIEGAIVETEKALAEIDKAIEACVETLDDLEEAIRYLDNRVVELDAKIAELNNVLNSGSNESIEAVMESVAATREAVESTIKLVQTAVASAAELSETVAELSVKAAEAMQNAAENALTILEGLSDEMKDYTEGFVDKEIEAIKEKYAEEIALLENNKELILAAGALAAKVVYDRESQPDGAITALNAKIEQGKKDLETAEGEAKDYLDTNLPIWEQELKDLEAKVEAEAQEAHDKAVAEAEVAYNMTLAYIEEMLPKVQAEMEAAIAEAQAAYAQVKPIIDAAIPVIENILANSETVLAAVEAAVPMAMDAVEKAVQFVIDTWNQAYNNATTSAYLLNSDSYYIALGDSSAYGEKTYVDELAAELKIGAYKNLSSDKNDVLAQMQALATDKALQAEVAKADLITVGFSQVPMINGTIESLMAYLDGKAEAPDWAKFVGEENVRYINAIRDELVEGFTTYMDEPMDEATAKMVTAAIEAYAYGVTAYACVIPEMVNAIHAINPHAVVTLVGLYNPLDGVTVDIMGQEFGFGEYIDYLVTGAQVHGTAYSMITGNSIYVNAPAVETVNEKDTLALMDLVELISTKCAALNPSANGHDYIQKCIYEALFTSNPAVMRVFGEDRYETALAAADTMLDVTGAGKFDAVVVATGRDFADALAGSYLAAEMDAPILLIKDSKADLVAGYIAENLNENGVIYVLGGEAVVSAATFAKLEKVGLAVRLEGENRYETNLAILNEAGAKGGELLIATGKNYADALSASSTGLPVMLVSSSLKAEQKEFLANAGFSKLTILGGEAAVSAEVAAELAAYAKVERVAGADRYETSALIADHFFGGRTGSVVVASGRDYPDALCGGALAAAAGVPVVLTKHGGITVADNYAVKAELGIVLGGEATGITKQDIVDIFELLNEGDIENVLYVG